MNTGLDIIRTFKEMVRMDTTNPPGNERIIVDYLSGILSDDGIDFEVVEPEERRASIVARIGPEHGEPPAILISHLDVVAADADEWADPPFDAIERDGIIYGRGTLDTKYLTAMELEAFLAMRDAALNRPVYFVATADEEKGSTLGMPHVAERWREAFANGIVINEGGGFFVEHDGLPFYLCTAGEKGRCTFTATMRGTAGPSSFPSEDNAIHKLMDLLDSMSARSFPAEDNPVASRFDELMREEIDDPFLRSFRDYNRRDTFILKKYDAGSQANVLPHEISFEAELQLVPSRTREYAEQVLTEVFAKVDAEWEVTGFRDGFASDLSNGAFASLARSTAAHFDGAQLLPVYALGQTDGRFLGALGCDVYGFAPVTRDIPFSEVLTLVHQNNEKVSRDSITTGAQILEQLIRDIGQVSV